MVCKAGAHDASEQRGHERNFVNVVRVSDFDFEDVGVSNRDLPVCRSSGTSIPIFEIVIRYVPTSWAVNAIGSIHGSAWADDFNFVEI